MKNKIYKLFSVVMSLVMIVSTLTVLTGLTATAAEGAYTITTAGGYDSAANKVYADLKSDYGDNILEGKTVYAKKSVYNNEIVAKTDSTWMKITDGNPASANEGVFQQNTTRNDSGNLIDACRKWYFDLSAMTEIEQITLFNETSSTDLELCDFEIYVSDDVASLWQDDNKVVDYSIDINNASKGFNMIQIAFNEKPQGRYLGFYWPHPCNFRTKNEQDGNTTDYDFVRLTEIAAFGKQVYTITATAGEGGAISPSGTKTVQTGSSVTYEITTNPGYIIKDVLVDGASVGAVRSYTFNNVTENHKIEATFVGSYTITTAGGYDTAANKVYADLKSDYGDNILEGKTVYAKKSVYNNEIVAKTDSTWMKITDGNPASANEGVFSQNTTRNDSGNLIDAFRKWYFDLSAMTEIEQITLFNETSSTDLALCKFEIYVSDDVASLWQDDNKVVDYSIDINNVSTGFNMIQIAFNEKPQGRYLGIYWPHPCNFRTKNEQDGNTTDYDIVRLTEIAAFGKQIYTITATAGDGGAISPPGETFVKGGENAVYTITANNGCHISKLLVDGDEVSEAVGKTEYTYTFSKVSANRTISVEFVTPFSFTNEFVSKDDLPSKYTNLLDANGENLLSGKTPYGYASKSANNYDYNYVDKSATWGVLTDGNAAKESSVVIEGFWGNVYFELDNIVDLNKLVLFNSFSGMRDGLQIQNFDVFVGNNPDTLWDKGNIVASYNASKISASDNAKVITLDFNQDGLAKGKYIGIHWKAPYNFETSSSIVLTEILAFGDKCATVKADAKGSGTISSYDAIEFNSDVEYTFKPDKGYKVVDVLVDSESVGASETLIVSADGNSHKVKVEFAIIGDTDNNQNLNADDVVKLRKTLLGIENFCEYKYANVNGDSDVDICDLVRTTKVLDDMEYNEDITMLAKGLGLDYFDIQDALERGDDLNNISNVNTARVQQVMQKANKGESITLAVIGGSITEGAFNSTNSSYASEEVNKHFGNKSYAEWVQKWFADKFYKGDTSKVTLVNAGIGSTTSLLGSFRLQSMVLDEKPDLVIVEFSVNDFATIAFRDSVIYLGDGAYEAYESIVRRCLEADVAVMQLFMGHTKERGLWTVHRVIGSYYNVPMVSFENAVYPNDSCIIGDTTKVYKDGMHPNNVGHAFLGKVISNYLDKIYANTDADAVYTASTVPIECVYGDTYANAKNTILYACENQGAATGSFKYNAEESSKWGGAYVNDGTADGTITATIPAGVKKVYVLYDVEASTSGSFTTKLGENDNVEVNYEYKGLPIWSAVYSADALTEDTTITLTSDSLGLNVIGFMLQY